MEEIWGCVKYIGIPYDAVMSMPIQVRKNWIMRHNMEQETLRAQAEGKNGKTGSIVSGEGVNAFASLEQENNSNRK